MENEAITGMSLKKFPDVVEALALVKASFAAANAEWGLLEREKAEKIVRACAEIQEKAPPELFCEFWVEDLSVLDHKMNKWLACKTGIAEREAALAQTVPVLSQAVESVVIGRRLRKALEGTEILEQELRRKALEFSDKVRVSRTHMAEDALSTWGQVFGALALSVERARGRLQADLKLFSVSLAGSFVLGSYLAPRDYARSLCAEIASKSSLPMTAPQDAEGIPAGSAALDQLMGSDRLMILMSDVRLTAMAFTRMCHGFFVYGSGPRAGIAEIILPAIAPGSTIMPGKINPSMPMLLLQEAEHILASDQMSVYSYNELDFDGSYQSGGAFIMATESLELIDRGSRLFTEKCLKGFGITEASAIHANQFFAGGAGSEAEELRITKNGLSFDDLKKALNSDWEKTNAD